MRLYVYSIYIEKGVKAKGVYADSAAMARFLAKKAYRLWLETGKQTGTDMSGRVIKFDIEKF